MPLAAQNRANIKAVLDAATKKDDPASAYVVPSAVVCAAL